MILKQNFGGKITCKIPNCKTTLQMQACKDERLVELAPYCI